MGSAGHGSDSYNRRVAKDREKRYEERPRARPGMLESAKAFLGVGDPANIEIEYPDGSRGFETATSICRRALANQKFELPDIGAKSAQRILDARIAVLHERFPEVSQLQRGEKPDVPHLLEYVDRGDHF